MKLLDVTKMELADLKLTIIGVPYKKTSISRAICVRVFSRLF